GWATALVALLGKFQRAVGRLDGTLAVAARRIEVVINDALRRAIEAVQRLASVRPALARHDVRVAQELAVVRPRETVLVPATALRELAFPTMALEACERRERRFGGEQASADEHGGQEWRERSVHGGLYPSVPDTQDQADQRVLQCVVSAVDEKQL